MVLLPCPRLQRGTGHSSDPDDTSSSDDISERTARETLPHLPQSQLDDERQELADIFRPSTPQSESRIRVPFRSKSSPSKAPGTQPQAVAQKKSRVSLISLPGKLRRRLSREVRLSKKASGLSITQNQTPSVDILGNGRGSDCGYDSDAHYILTPQISRGLDGSPFSVRLNQAKGPISPPGVIQNDPTVVSTGSGSTATGESNNLGNIAAVPNSGDVDETPHQATTSREELSRVCTPHANEGIVDRTGCVTPADSFLEDQAFFTPPDGQSPAGLTSDIRAVSVRETPSNGTPSQLRKDDDEIRLRLPNDDPGIGSSSRGPERSPPPIPCRHPLREESPCSDLREPCDLSRTAPDYRSQSAYSDDTPSYRPAAQQQSQMCHQQESSHFSESVSALGFKESVPEQPAGTSTRCGEAETDRTQENTVACRDSNADKKSSRISLLLSPDRLVPRSRSSSQGKLQVAKRNSTPLTASRFVENFEDLSTGNDPQTQPSSQNRREHRTSSEGWLSGGRRLGFGYNFVADVERDPIPKAAVQQQDDMAQCTPQDVGDFSAAKKDQKGSSSCELTGAMAAGVDGAGNGASAEGPAITQVSDSKSSETKVAQLRRSLSITSWAKSPVSAIRERLSLDAGLDKTAGEPKKDTRSATPATDVESVSSGLRSRGLFKPWTRLSNSNSMMKKDDCQHHGTIASATTQSIHASSDVLNERRDPLGVLEELSESKSNVKQIPRQPVSQLTGPSIHDVSDGGPARYDGPSDVEFPLETSHGIDQDDTRSVSEVSSAEAWSQMYQDCLPHLSISEETDASPAVGNGVCGLVKRKG